MKLPRCGAVTFLLTGLAWLLVMAVTGMALYVGTVRSLPLPSTLRVVHAHGTLIGGVLQMLAGALMAFRHGLGLSGATSQPGRYLALNVGTVAMLIGLWFHHYAAAGIAGLVAIGPLFPLCGEVYGLSKHGRLGTAWTTWSCAFLGTAFVAGSLFGLLYSLGLVPPEWIIHTRLAHVHLTILGFLTVVSVGVLQSLLTATLRIEIWSARLTQLGSTGLLLGISGLLVGVGVAHIPVQLCAGVVLLCAIIAIGFNLFRSWLAAPTRPPSADHLLLGTLFLLLTTALGVLVDLNAWVDPRPFPFGSLHLVAYTHMMFVGMLLHLTFGGLTAWLPELLAQERLASHKKRQAYATRLHSKIVRWHAPQLATLSLGTMGLAAVAALTWQYPLGSPPVQTSMWISLALLLISFVVFAAKVGMVWGTRPDVRNAES